eukprot:s2256_g6.t1
MVSRGYGPSSALPVAAEVPVSDEDIGDELQKLLDNMHLDHVRAVEIDSPTTISFEVYLIPEARIPSMSVSEPDPGCKIPKTDVPFRDLEVSTMAGNIIKIQVAPDSSVATVKDALQKPLGLPALLQRIVLSAKELGDSEQLPPDVTALTVLRREPPPITTEEFLESLAFCVHDWNGTLVSKWHRFDTYSSFPVTKDERFEWFRNFQKMKHTAFTVENFLTSLNLWFPGSRDDDEQKVAHPESFLTDVEKLQGFLEQHCHSPSLFQVYEHTYGHDDDLEFVLFIAGRLKVASDTLMVAAVHLNCSHSEAALRLAAVSAVLEVSKDPGWSDLTAAEKFWRCEQRLLLDLKASSVSEMKVPKAGSKELYKSFVELIAEWDEAPPELRMSGGTQSGFAAEFIEREAAMLLSELGGSVTHDPDLAEEALRQLLKRHFSHGEDSDWSAPAKRSLEGISEQADTAPAVLTALGASWPWHTVTDVQATALGALAAAEGWEEARQVEDPKVADVSRVRVGLIVDSFRALRLDMEARENDQQTQTFISCIDRRNVEQAEQVGLHGLHFPPVGNGSRGRHGIEALWIFAPRVRDLTGPEYYIRQLMDKGDVGSQDGGGTFRSWPDDGRFLRPKTSRTGGDRFQRIQEQSNYLASFVEANQDSWKSISRTTPQLNSAMREKLDS